MGTVTGMARNTGKGPYRHMRALWKGGLAVASGDFCFNDSLTPDANSAGQYYDKSVASYTTFGAGTHSQAQVAAKALFRGVSLVRRTTLQTTDGDDTTDGAIAATGEFTFPCSSLGSAAQIGSYVGIAQGTGGAQTLAAQQVEIVGSASNAIGRLTEYAPVGSLYLTFEILPYDGITNGVSAVS